MLEILTPCRGQSHQEERCAVHCPELNEPVWNEFLGGWFHVVQLLSPQERTARAHAQQQRDEFIAEKVREAKERVSESAFFQDAGELRDILDSMRYAAASQIFQGTTAPSEPGTTIPPQLDP